MIINIKQKCCEKIICIRTEYLIPENYVQNIPRIKQYAINIIDKYLDRE